MRFFKFQKKNKKKTNCFFFERKKGGTMRYLVTGCCGFIGSQFVRNILHDATTEFVVGIDCLYPCATKTMCESTPRYIFYQNNINENGLIARLLVEHNIDVLVHFAAQSHVDTSFSSPHNYINDNICGTFQILEALRQTASHHITKMIMISTDEVYGENKVDEPHYEKSSLLQPSSVYSASKAAAEMLCHAYVASHKIPIVTLRGNNCYGRQYPEKLIPRFIKLILEGKPLTIQGTGKQKRSFLYVDDFCSAISCLIEKGEIGAVYNVGSDDELSVLEVAQILAEEMKCELKLRFVEDRNFNDTRYLVHSDKLKELGWKQKTRFREGLRKTIAWFQSKESNNYWVQEYQIPIQKDVNKMHS